MVSRDKKNITKIFLSKSYAEKLAESRLSLGNFWKPVFTGIPEIYQVTKIVYLPRSKPLTSTTFEIFQIG